MKFLLIGNGFISPTHKKAIEQIKGEIVDCFGIEKGESYWQQAIEKTNADCVVILTPNDLHFSMVKKALENKKIVLCEKPLVINSKDMELIKNKNVFTVLQLRHHPLTKELKKEISKDKKYEIQMDISVHRDPEYYQCWKGQKQRSGGVVFNLGIHYFDLLLYLFGGALEVKTDCIDDKTAKGIIKGKNYTCSWRVNTDETREKQRRVFKINGLDYNFSSKDNLAFENLHVFVYQDLLEKKGVLPEECLKSIKLIEKIYEKV
ncbi:MAG: Gfo/Idh/MocA family oxidoreductase [Candidatus Pacebacteria bacterium]|nr:Gfo/Idh/MocA family oxidoreductase [Candidatus Paceibacterota bacterium]